MTKRHRAFALAAALSLVASASTLGAQPTTGNVFVPGNTLGGFGNPSVDGDQPYVYGIAATGPGRITISYISGTVTDYPDINTGPDGALCKGCFPKGQSPLNEAAGLTNESEIVTKVDALLGVFVEQSRVQAPGFSPVDGSKAIAAVGVFPASLFLVGISKTLDVKYAGTLYLGINDCDASTNSGGFNVSVTFTPE